MPDIPRFVLDELDSGLFQNDLGAAFQSFASEWLGRRFQDVHEFPSRGRDGGIDLLQERGHSRAAFECKYTGSDGSEAVIRRWRVTASRLRKHLVRTPSDAQAQYEPWFRQDVPITQYTLCTNAILSTAGQRDQVQEEVKSFFRSLAAANSGVQHLGEISVDLIDWNDFIRGLRAEPLVTLRWFPRTRPLGLVPIDSELPDGGFREFLHSNRLPYYSRGQHFAGSEDFEALELEEDLVASLLADDTSGLVITGGGGVGKTRLGLELGRLAHAQGWLALRAEGNITASTIEQLAKRLTVKAPVVVTLDYVEMQSDFIPMVHALNQINDTYELSLRYIANCRTSYYRSVEAVGRHRRVALTMHDEHKIDVNLTGYRKKIVEHILVSSGVSDPEAYLPVCAALPVLAVFVAYLKNHGRTGELTELRGERDFGEWVAKRVRMSFGPDFDHRNLALLVSLLPMPEGMAGKLQEFRPLFDSLASDAWIERSRTGGTDHWRSTHDVFADQVIQAYLTTIPATTDLFAADLLDVACRYGGVGSAFLTLQRLVDVPSLQSVDWASVLHAAVIKHPGEMRVVRNVLLQTPLLTAAQSIRLLDVDADWFAGAEKETGFQISLGFLLAKIMETDTEVLGENEVDTLRDWLRKAVDHPGGSSLFLVKGLQFDREITKAAALAWITDKPRQFLTTHLMGAWLRAKLPPQEISEAVRAWLTTYGDLPSATYVISTWLNAGGNVDVIRKPALDWLAQFAPTDEQASFVLGAWLHALRDPDAIRAHIVKWLTRFGSTGGASFVYRSWLDAGGESQVVAHYVLAWLEEFSSVEAAHYVFRAWLDSGAGLGPIRTQVLKWLKEVGSSESAHYVLRAWLSAGGSPAEINEYLTSWLDEYGTVEGADWLYRAWLEHGGEFSVVKDHALAWLHEHATAGDASFITKVLTKQADLGDAAVRDILTWCRSQAVDPDAMWRLTQLGRKLLRPSVAEDVLLTFEAVVGRFISGEVTPDSTVKGQIESGFSFLISGEGFRTGALRARVDELLTKWFRNPESYGTDPPHIHCQRFSYFQRFVELIKTQALDATQDWHAIGRFIAWVNTWEPDRRRDIARAVQFLKATYPHTLWSTLRTGDS